MGGGGRRTREEFFNILFHIIYSLLLAELESEGRQRRMEGGNPERRGREARRVRMEAQCAAALVYQLPGGRHSERRASGVGSWKPPANGLQALPRTRAACGCKDLVFNCAGWGIGKRARGACWRPLRRFDGEAPLLMLGDEPFSCCNSNWVAAFCQAFNVRL